MSDQTNQDPNLQNDDAPTKQNLNDLKTSGAEQNDDQKTNDAKTSVTHHVGGVESTPVSVESAPKVEDYLETSEPEPQISEEVKNVGVEKVHEKPKLHPDVQKVGVTHSIPDKPNYEIKDSYKSDVDAKVKFEKGDVAEANTFRALEYFKNFKKGLLSALNQTAE